jgi:hypothetical protein
VRPSRKIASSMSLSAVMLSLPKIQISMNSLER